VGPDAELERSLHDLEPFHLTGVHVALPEKAARASHHLDLQRLAVRLRGGLEDLDPHAQRRKVEHISRLRHLSLPEQLRDTWRCANPWDTDQRPYKSVLGISPIVRVYRARV
jgi:hypothetical protein